MPNNINHMDVVMLLTGYKKPSQWLGFLLPVEK